MEAWATVLLDEAGTATVAAAPIVRQKHEEMVSASAGGGSTAADAIAAIIAAAAAAAKAAAVREYVFGLQLLLPLAATTRYYWTAALEGHSWMLLLQ